MVTSNPDDLKQADFYIIAVPTPINHAKQPDMSCVLGATETVGKQLKKGDIVVYESTVYPGATEEECMPVLEKFSGLRCGKDFFIGYSPERINPGDKEHSFKNIRKVVAGQNPKVLEIIADVYASVVIAGVYRASSIKVAEAAKVIENTQRDINIALINELAVIFEKMDIDTSDVLAAAGTKWNFLPFKPGLVGGHCIGVDPYYLTYKANVLGLYPEVILSGRKINDNMGKYIAEQTIKKMIKMNKSINGATVAIAGLTFKENCNDIRNTRVVDIIAELRSYHINVLIHDPLADPKEVKHEYGIDLSDWSEIKNVDAMILAVAHKFYLDMPPQNIINKLAKPALLIDVKSVFDREFLKKNKIEFWRL
ncbi:MAG: GDP-mannose dehydrogenase [Gammaproteobacteria bacterium RBG_16_37_9]|nr:MAG: GDP-mannose dehydrogenase [Gammaproteobacteria bacterium RBG_16_37_9]